MLWNFEFPIWRRFTAGTWLIGNKSAYTFFNNKYPDYFEGLTVDLLKHLEENQA